MNTQLCGYVCYACYYLYPLALFYRVESGAFLGVMKLGDSLGKSGFRITITYDMMLYDKSLNTHYSYICLNGFLCFCRPILRSYCMKLKWIQTIGWFLGCGSCHNGAHSQHVANWTSRTSNFERALDRQEAGL